MSPAPRFPRHPLCLAIALLGASPLALAESTQDLDTLEITAERLAADRVVDEADIERHQANDLRDTFAGQPEVAVGGGIGIAQKVYVRGLEDTQLNVSIDGATQAGTLFHHSGRLAVDPELLKRVEVDTGAGRATAGAGALGGAIRFVTKDPDDLLRDGERLGALINLGSFSNGEGYRASTTLFGRFTDDWSGMVSLRQSDQDEYEDGDGNRIDGTDATQELGLFKLVGRLGGGQTLRLSHEIRTDEGTRPQRPQWAISGFNSLYQLDGRRETTTLNYGLAPADTPWLDLDLTLYHNESEIEQNVVDRWGRYFGFTRSTGGDLRNTSRLGAHTLTYGVDHRRDRVNAGGEDDPRAEQESGRVTGVYVQDDYQITEDLLLSAGLRYDHYRLTDANDQRFREEAVSPNANLRWQALDGLTLHAGYAEAFRGPSTRDTFKIDRAQNAPGLRGETARNTEVGFDYVLGDLTLAGEVYRSTIEDAVADRLFGPTIYDNIGDLESDGYRLEARYQWGALHAGLGFHHNDATLDGDPLTVYEHNLMGNTIGDTWVADLSYQWSPSLEFGWRGRFVEGIDGLETSVGRIDKPGYGVHDVFVHWLPTDNEDLRLTLAVHNLTDHQYLDHASNADFQHIPGYEGVVGLPEPGRDVRLGLVMRF